MERCDRCESVGRKSEIKGLPHHLIGPNGIKMTMCNLCYTEFQDEVGEIIYFTNEYHEDEED